jgi:hypothetical protein
MKLRSLVRWTSALILAGCMALAGQALAQSNSVVLATPQLTLVSQPSNSLNPPSNTDASYLPSVNSQGADDFVVPSNLFWHITAVTARGRDVGTSGTGYTSVVVQFYRDSGHALPGSLLYSVSYSSGSYLVNNGTITVSLNSIVVLGPGHYWLSVQPHVPSCPDSNCRRWLWNESPGPYNAESVWQGNWLGICLSWQPRVTTCGRPSDSSGKDLAFELDGTTAPVLGRVLLPAIRR